MEAPKGHDSAPIEDTPPDPKTPLKKSLSSHGVLPPTTNENDLKPTEPTPKRAWRASAHKPTQSNSQSFLGANRPDSIQRSLPLLGVERIKSENSSILETERPKPEPPSYAHNFVEKSFTYPTECKFCFKFIWGIMNSGLFCSQCEYAIHKPCKDELSIMNCSGIKGCFHPFYTLKLAICGPARCGKKTLIMAHSGVSKLKKSNETVYYYRNVTKLYDKREFGVEIFCLPSEKQGVFERLEVFKQSDIVFLCFPIDCSELLESKSILELWKKEIHSESEPLLFLVGCKSDLRNENAKNLISRELAEKYTKEIGAVKYMECSGETKVGVNHLFFSAVEECVKRLDGKQ